MQGPNSRQNNYLTVDCEDWFQVFYGSRTLSFEDWSTQDSRIEFMVNEYLDLFERHNVKATFFIVAWLSRSHAKLIRKVSEMGHEIASHSVRHLELTTLSNEDVRSEIVDSKKMLEDVTGKTVLGFRAPGFSIPSTESLYLDFVKEAGYKYDSSVLNTRTDPFEIRPGLLEFSPLGIRFGDKHLPTGGGFVFRSLPYFVYESYLKFRRNSGPLNLYLHTWEITSDYPRMKMPFTKSFVQYFNLNSVKPKLDKILGKRAFLSIEQALPV